MPKSPLFLRKQAGGVFLATDESETTGEIFFVSSGTGTDGAGYGKNPDTPLATIDYAIGLCTANKGDRIYVMPGHTETIAAAGGITADIAGISIIGLGNGNNRPLISFSAVGSTFAISADGVTVKNLRCKPTVDELVTMFSISAAYCTLDGIEHVDNSTTAQTLQFVLTTAAADYLTIQNCRCYQANAANTAQKWIQLVGTDRTRIVDNTFIIVGNASTSSHLISGSTAVVHCEISRNLCWFTGGTITIVINLVTGSTGIINDNRLFSGTSVATAAAITGDGCCMYENYWSDSAAASGLLAPAVDTDT